MMPRRLLFAGVIIAIAVDVFGQTTTADGVAALARGDYERAVEILKPLAEGWRSTDRAAQFLMAGLYETGRGVPLDPVRACALYMRASSDSNDPFGRQALSRSAALVGRGTEFNEECHLLANVGFDSGFEPVTFDLGPGHFVHWTLAAATVTFDGRTERTPIGFAFWNARFLPLEYTELATGPMRSSRRHFIEMFAWYPSTQNGSAWDLRWHLFEVVRDHVIPIDTPGPLANVEGHAPPSRDSFNARDYAVLRVDDQGNSEWAVLKGPHPKTQRIETDAERREAAAEESEARKVALARDAVLKKIDWSARSDVARQPTMSYVDAEGCGDIQVFGWTPNRDEVISVRASAAALRLSQHPATFDLAHQPADISVETFVYDAPRRRFDFCTDVVIRESGETEPVKWRAVAGTIAIELSPRGTRGRTRATVTLTNVVLRNAAGTTVRIAGPVRLTAVVGSVFG